MKKMAFQLKGIIPPMVTPLLSNDTLDVAGLERLLERMLAGGVSGVFVLGSTGEAPSLSYRLRREVIAESSRIINGRVPMLVGVADTSFEETVALSRYAAERGATALVVAPPFYFPVSGNDLRRYYQDLIRKLPLPMILYHMPGLTKVRFDAEMIAFAVDTPEIIALKESSGDLDFFWRSCRMARCRKHFPVLMGPEHLLAASIRLGGSGGVNGGANVFPELFVNMYHAAVKNDVATMDVLQKKIDRLNDIYAVPTGGMGVCRGMKYALKCLGVCGDLPAEPFHLLPRNEKKKIEAILDELK
ncbi:MAG: dihydrodipicolinate synthase family protein [Planctomycetia bacterium]|nr:dihydrodipicolinate synthase family protein [Planctomycetia bacterium]